MERLTRRDMLRIGAAGLAAGMAKQALGQAAPATAPAGEPIRLGLIGHGGRGAGLLRALIRRKNEPYRIVAVCDIREANLASGRKVVTEGLGYTPEAYGKDPDDFKRLLERKDIDGVVMATPCCEHARMFLAAIQAGKHIYGEKPMSLTVADADAVVAAASANPKLTVQVGFQWMLNARMMDAISRAQKGQIGELIDGRFFRHNGATPMLGWFGHRQQSGDWMLEQGCHEYNIMNCLAKATPVRAYGIGRNDLYTDMQPDRNVTDQYSAIIEFPNGFTIHYTHGWISPKGFGGMSMAVVGTKGAVDIMEGRIALRDEKAAVDPIKPQETNDTEDALVSFINSVRTGKPPAATVANGRNATLTALLVRKAVYEHKVVSWGEMLRTC